MKFSIITVCYNAPPNAIDLTLASLHGQEGVEIEHIVIDGASQPETLEALQRHASSFDEFVSEPDQGIYDAMNKGLKLVTGDVVFFLNVGDSFVNSKALIHVSQIMEDPSIDLCYCNTDHAPGPVSDYPARLKPMWLYNHSVCHQSIFARSHLFQSVGNFDTSYQIAADNDWLVRAIRSGARHLRISEVLTKMPTGGYSDNADAWHCDYRLIRQRHFSKWERGYWPLYNFGFRLARRLSRREFHLPPTWRFRLKQN